MSSQLLHNEAIVAQCTPQGSGAVALIRVCTPQGSQRTTRQIVQECAHIPTSSSQPHTLLTAPSHTIIYGWMVEAPATSGASTKAVIDQVLFLVMDGPHTFTGDDTIEITCHNNPFIVEAILARLCKAGCRVARPGEFSQRAVLNGKLDITQAEAINDLVTANTQYALKRSLAQLKGSLSEWVHDLEQRLLKAAAWCQASFEFLDDEGDFAPQIQTFLADARDRIEHARSTYNQQKLLRSGFRIALIGSVNAGKSSLFNVLIQEQRAIVSDYAGTTRDTIEAGLYRNGAYWTIIDTAGLRQTDDVIEREGIRRSYDEATKADVILLVYDRSRPLTQAERVVYDDIVSKFGHKIITVYTKADLPSALTVHDAAGYHVSGVDGYGRTALEGAIQDKIMSLIEHADTPFLLNRRHMHMLEQVDTELVYIQSLLTQPRVAYELVSYHLHHALEMLSGLTGKSVSEESMDLIFREFCVGK